MEQQISINTQRINFIDALNQGFLSVKGYGAGAYLTSNSILRLFNQYQTQNQSEQQFIKSVIREYY